MLNMRVFLKNTTLLLALLLHSSIGHAQQPLPPKSLVLMGGCTGVCVDSRGIVVSAKHCEHGETVSARFSDGSPITLKKLASSPLADGAVAFKITDPPGPFPFMPITKREVKVGELVHCWGYPKEGEASHYGGALTGLVSSGGGWIHDDNGLPVPWSAKGQACWFIETSMYVAQGVSGGPLLNAQDEVVGLCSAISENRTLFTNLNDLSRVYKEAISRLDSGGTARKAPGGPSSPSNLVTVYTIPRCRPCELLKADYEAGQYPGVNMLFVDASGREDIREVPTLEVNGQRSTLGEICHGLAYSVDAVAHWLARFILPPNPMPSPGPQPYPIDSDKPAPKGKKADDPVIHVLVSVSKLVGDQPGLYGELAAEALDVALEAISDQLQSAVSVAEIALVTERTRPAAYAELQKISPTGPFGVYIAVDKADLSWWQAGPAALVEQVLEDKLGPIVHSKNIPLVLAFERSGDMEYYYILRAKDIKESLFNFPGLSDTFKPAAWVLWLVGLLVPGAWVAYLRRGWLAVRVVKWLLRYAHDYFPQIPSIPAPVSAVPPTSPTPVPAPVPLAAPVAVPPAPQVPLPSPAAPVQPAAQITAPTAAQAPPKATA